MNTRPAVFLDRDNTIIADPGYLHEPARVELLRNAAAGLKAMATAGWPLVIISNQSGIARGLFSEREYHAVMSRLRDLLEPFGVTFAADYFCPHLESITGPCACRKPGTLLFRRAAQDLELDLVKSWYLGDRWRDVQPALALGGHGLLIGSPPRDADEPAEGARADVARAKDLVEAARIVGRPRV